MKSGMRKACGLGDGSGREVEHRYESRSLRRTVWLGEMGSSGVDRESKSVGSRL